MSFLYEIVSGNVVAGVNYQVVGGTSVVYNSVTYNAGDYFTGVDGVDTYTKTAGTEIVTEASDYEGLDISIETFKTDKFEDESFMLGVSSSILDDFYLGKFTDESTFLGMSVSIDLEYQQAKKVSNIRVFPYDLKNKQLEFENKV